jgi:hypothetical protein
MASQRFGLEKSAFVSKSCLFSTTFISIFQGLYKHFAYLCTPKYHPLLLMASDVFSLGQGIKHWFTSKAAINLTSFIDQQEMHPPY